MNMSLLNKDTSTFIDKIKKKLDSNKNQDTNVKFNHGYDNILSKTGLGNTLRGTKEVLNNQNIYNKKSLKENTMTIPIKDIILEFTADHIRDNAGKYAAGTMLGLGAAAGYLAGDPEHGSNIFNSNHSSDSSTSDHAFKNDTRSDFQKDLANASQTKETINHNQNKGLLGNFSQSVNHFTNNLKAENKFNDLADAQEEYNNIKNSSGNLLTGGQMASIAGVGTLGVAGAALAAKRKK